MSGLFALLTAVLVSAAVSSVVVLALKRPLRMALQQICPGADAIAFWVSFTTTMLYLAPLLFAVLFVLIPASPSLVDVLRSALAAALAGTFAALLVIGYQIAKARPRPL
jgi:hypothetical protein